MTPFLFRCPATGMMVQGFAADDTSGEGPSDAYIGIECLACRRIHLIDPVTKRVVTDDKA